MGSVLSVRAAIRAGGRNTSCFNHVRFGTDVSIIIHAGTGNTRANDCVSNQSEGE